MNRSPYDEGLWQELGARIDACVDDAEEQDTAESLAEWILEHDAELNADRYRPVLVEMFHLGLEAKADAKEQTRVDAEDEADRREDDRFYGSMMGAV